MSMLLFVLDFDLSVGLVPRFFLEMRLREGTVHTYHFHSTTFIALIRATRLPEVGLPSENYFALPAEWQRLARGK